MMTVPELRQAATELKQWITWQHEMLTLYHDYCHSFGRPPGMNVFELVLIDALRGRGLTLEQFKAQCAEREAQS